MPDLPSTLPAELTPLTSLVGRWERGGAAEHWVAAGDVLIGVAFSPGGSWEVMTIDRVNGQIRFVGRPNGGEAVPFPLVSTEGGSWVFLNPAHDDPQRITYRVDSKKLRAGIGLAEGPDRATWKLKAVEAVSAPELEAADRAWHDAVAARGVDGWVEGFDPGGHKWDDQHNVRVDPGSAMKDHMAGTLAGRLDWEPVRSGLAPSGDLGWTVGDWVWTSPDGSEPAGRGAYVTLWRRQPAGGWKVLFDTGDPIE